MFARGDLDTVGCRPIGDRQRTVHVPPQIPSLEPTLVQGRDGGWAVADRECLQTKAERRGEIERIHHRAASELTQRVINRFRYYLRPLAAVEPEDQTDTVPGPGRIRHHCGDAVLVLDDIYRDRMIKLLPPARINLGAASQRVGEHLVGHQRLPDKPVGLHQLDHRIPVTVLERTDTRGRADRTHPPHLPDRRLAQRP
jgi:hypothetical protein